MTDKEFFAMLRFVADVEIVAAVREQVQRINGQGANVSIFEVLQNGDILIVIHSEVSPPVGVIRRALLDHHGLTQ